MIIKIFTKRFEFINKRMQKNLLINTLKNYFYKIFFYDYRNCFKIFIKRFELFEFLKVYDIIRIV